MSGRFSIGALGKRAGAFIIAGLGAALAVLISFASAIYEASQPKDLVQAAAGQSVDTGRWTVVARRAEFGRNVRGAPASQQDRLAVELELTNRSAATSPGYTRLLELESPPAGLQRPTFYLARDSAIASGLHPDMPERVIAVWTWPPGALPPQKVRFKVTSQIYKKRDNLYGAPGWFDGPTVATLDLTIGGPDPVAGAK
ncbi:MAG TPA: hypothetical protein VJR58_31385 [Vineibacter sp.]|nr:hypothetical protein [Vineibacter sp.]